MPALNAQSLLKSAGNVQSNVNNLRTMRTPVAHESASMGDDLQRQIDAIIGVLQNPPPAVTQQTQRTLSDSPVAFVVNNGDIANDAALCPLIATANSVSQCLMYVKASDAAIDLTFNITQNGTSVFNAPITIPAATAAGTEIVSTNFIPAPLPLQVGDKFKLNITSGSTDWMLTIQMER